MGCVRSASRHRISLMRSIHKRTARSLLMYQTRAFSCCLSRLSATCVQYPEFVKLSSTMVVEAEVADQKADQYPRALFMCT